MNRNNGPPLSGFAQAYYSFPNHYFEIYSDGLRQTQAQNNVRLTVPQEILCIKNWYSMFCRNRVLGTLSLFKTCGPKPPILGFVVLLMPFMAGHYLQSNVIGSSCFRVCLDVTVDNNNFRTLAEAMLKKMEDLKNYILNEVHEYTCYSVQRTFMMVRQSRFRMLALILLEIDRLSRFFLLACEYLKWKEVPGASALYVRDRNQSLEIFNDYTNALDRTNIVVGIQLRSQQVSTYKLMHEIRAASRNADQVNSHARHPIILFNNVTELVNQSRDSFLTMVQLLETKIAHWSKFDIRTWRTMQPQHTLNNRLGIAPLFLEGPYLGRERLFWSPEQILKDDSQDQSAWFLGPRGEVNAEWCGQRYFNDNHLRTRPHIITLEELQADLWHLADHMTSMQYPPAGTQVHVDHDEMSAYPQILGIPPAAIDNGNISQVGSLNSMTPQAPESQQEASNSRERAEENDPDVVPIVTLEELIRIANNRSAFEDSSVNSESSEDEILEEPINLGRRQRRTYAGEEAQLLAEEENLPDVGARLGNQVITVARQRVGAEDVITEQVVQNMGAENEDQSYGMIDTYREVAVVRDNEEEKKEEVEEEKKEESHFDEQATGELDFIILLNKFFNTKYSNLLLGDEGFSHPRFIPAIQSLYRMSLRDNFHVRTAHEATHMQFLVIFLAELLEGTIALKNADEPFDPYLATTFRLRCPFDRIYGVNIFQGYEDGEEFQMRNASVTRLSEEIQVFANGGAISGDMRACFPENVWRQLAQSTDLTDGLMVRLLIENRAKIFVNMARTRFVFAMAEKRHISGNINEDTNQEYGRSRDSQYSMNDEEFDEDMAWQLEDMVHRMREEDRQLMAQLEHGFMGDEVYFDELNDGNIYTSLPNNPFERRQPQRRTEQWCNHP